MNELHWLTTDRLDEMLKFLRNQPQLPVALVDRKLLYWIAETVRKHLDNEGGAVLVEKFAEGRLSVKQLRNDPLFQSLPSGMARFLHKNVPAAAQQMAYPTGYAARVSRRYYNGFGWQQEPAQEEAGDDASLREAYLVAHLRELFGNPWVAPNPDWRVAAGGIVGRLAEEIRLDGAWDLMPILGDALEDVGCAHDDVLEHCRADIRHRKGCWVLDLIALDE